MGFCPTLVRFCCWRLCATAARALEFIDMDDLEREGGEGGLSWFS